MAARSLLSALLVAFVLTQLHSARALTLSSRLIHRFSDEAKTLRISRNGDPKALGRWPQRSTMDYYHLLATIDFQKQNMKLGSRRHFQFLFPSEGGNTVSFGNDLGWLHYTWIDIGTPNVSFLVALDTGSDLLWVPCDCTQCAPLSATYYTTLDRDLHEYSPSGSNTSKHVSCSHELCESGPKCKNSKQTCPYTIEYYTENTSSSGLLVEDILHLAAGGDDASTASIRAPVIIGCGMKQSGGYLDGIAPDGLMGLGLGQTSVPTLLAKAGLTKNSFSMCFDEDSSGRLLFGDQGPATQQSTSFLPSNGNYEMYIVGVEACCIGNSCLKETSFKALVDSGTSFTFLPESVYNKIALEFDRRVNATIANYAGSPWKYCYNTSYQDLPKVPSVTLMFLANNSFVVHDPVFLIHGDQGVNGFCLAIQPAEGDTGTVGQNFMTGYRTVFDRENLKLGWSLSNCRDLNDVKSMPLAPPKGAPPNPLPTNEQQSTPGGFAPAVAGRAPSKPSAASSQLISSQIPSLRLLSLLLRLFLIIFVF
ncbi:aspartic proteinase-like protein 1 isoform X1 [Malus sylvestris]|uniref:aspartic proteinase-like protein 1 isoform X1 n=1 Tax=Malus domestica TaxID=3750 RepID=UPI0010AA0C01|nr:aspartic proteinase-like protein 1 isoform X1 [Malus domestica]XP_050147191.1 aspartic proteinase-like protein 1 isoform X1 [Malus sylvestris]